MIEILSYVVSHQQRKIGNYTLRSHQRAGRIVAEAELELKDFGETKRIWQQSEFDSRTFVSHSFRELNEGEGFTRAFHTAYDVNSGFLVARRKLNGEEEEVTRKPSLIAYSDSLALLYLGRYLSRGDLIQQRVPMLGKSVVVERTQSLAPLDLEAIARVDGLDMSDSQENTLHHYRCCPGDAHMFISSVAPYPIVKLIQPSHQGTVEAVLQTYRTQSGYLDPNNTRQRARRRRGKNRVSASRL